MKRARTASAPLTVQRHPSEGAAPPYVAAHPTIIESSPLTVPSSFSSTSRAATVETMRAYDLRTSGVTSNFQRNMEYHQADRRFSSHDVNDNGSIGVQRPTSIRSRRDAVPSTSEASMVKPSATLENNLRVPAGTPKLQSNATFGSELTSQWSVASFLPPVSSGYDPIAALEALVRRLEIDEESDSLRNSARIPDVNINAQRNATNYQDDGEASHCERTQMAGSKTSPHHPMSSSYSCDEAVPSTSHAVLEAAASAGNNASQPRESAETSNQPQRNPLENITWVCPFCAEKFNYSTDLIKHWDHTMVNGKHLCRSCGELFMRPSDFKSHYVNHTCKKP